MDDAKTKWERLQSRFKNSWFGIIILALIAVAVSLSQVGDTVKKLGGWVGPTPAAELRVQTNQPEPLDPFRDELKSAGPDTIYPFGATLRFDLRRVGGGDEQVSINGLYVRVDDYQPRGACPYTMPGDRIFGAGSAPPRVFNVRMSEGKVRAVQRKDEQNGQMYRSVSSNLLDGESPLALRLQKTVDEIETFIVTFIVDDPARYKIGLSIRYTNRNESKTVETPSVAICKPE
jgi:hypothetical protein